MPKTALAMMEPKPEDWRRTVPVWVILELDRLFPEGWRSKFNWINTYKIAVLGIPYVHVSIGEYTIFLTKD